MVFISNGLNFGWCEVPLTVTLDYSFITFTTLLKLYCQCRWGSYTFSGQKFQNFSRSFQDPTLTFQSLCRNARKRELELIMETYTDPGFARCPYASMYHRVIREHWERINKFLYCSHLPSILQKVVWSSVKNFNIFKDKKTTTTTTNVSTLKQGLEIGLLKFKTRTKPVEMTLFNPSSSRRQVIWPQHFKQMDITFTEWTPTLPGSDNHRLHWDLSLWKLAQYGRATMPGKTPSLRTKKDISNTKYI